MRDSDKRQILFDVARSLFLEQGYKKTNIAAITKRANVAVGTFYQYYPSKEHIFYQVYQHENEKVKREIISQIDTNRPPKEVIQQFLNAIFQMGQQNAILAEWYQNPEVARLIEKYNDSDIWESSYIYSFLIKNIKHWRESGQFRQDLDIDTMLALLHSLIVIDNHKEEIGSERYPSVFRLLIEMVVDGLSTKR